MYCDAMKSTANTRINDDRVVTFAVCWLPSHVCFLIEAYADVDDRYHMEMVAFQIGATCLAYINSCLNPVIYTFLSENFRLRQLLFSIFYRFISRHTYWRSCCMHTGPSGNLAQVNSDEDGKLIVRKLRCS